MNSPDQVVIAGHAQAVQRALEKAKAAGAKRAVLLPVSAPFHCPLMQPAQTKLRVDLDSTTFSDLAVPLINNWRAEEVTHGAEAREGLYQQVPNPVLWTDTVRRLAERGINWVIEVGAGSVLLGLCRSIDSSLRGVKFGDPADLDAVERLFA
jgi:[acyl-carrier-protein] S-malonyltransferase